MQNHAQYSLRLAQERIQRDIEHAADTRRATRSDSTLRRAIGHRIIRFGERLAAEPTLKLARPR
jgi:hypothetical protein